MEILPMGMSAAEVFRRAERLYLDCSCKRCVLSSGSLLMQGMLAVQRSTAARDRRRQL
jgi:hypothetical protein